MGKSTNRHLFELDRRMELKLRLAAKKGGMEAGQAEAEALLEALEAPPPELVKRLIAKVRAL